MTQPGHVVIGTAGHIDHGKTMLVQALTGKNTDRLQEEQARGISIDIDFAPLVFADGTVAGIVDVPGHERFVRNMVAGAAGIDGALIVVDINEGMMPQTYEHLSILQLFGVKRAVVALTKADLADADLLDVGAEVVADALAQTPFAGSPLVPTSVKTGQGLEELRDRLYELVRSSEPRDVRGAFRLPVDKVFSIPGFGTVVSGTVWRGSVHVGDTLEVLPMRQSVRVRGIQVHGRSVETAEAGQRSALNLVGIDKSQIRRGYVVAAQGTLVETELLDTRIELLSSVDRALKHRDRVHLHLGTAEAIGTVLLLDADAIDAGGNGYAQIQLDRPVVADTLDRFILRRYSPVTTIGGGHVIDPRPKRLHRRKREHILSMLADRDSDSPRQRLTALLKHGVVKDVNDLAVDLAVTVPEMESLLEDARADGIVLLLPGGWTDAAYVEQTLSDVEQSLWQLHQKQRFLTWMPRTKLLAGAELPFRQRDALWLVEEGVRRGLWQVEQTRVKAVDWEVRLAPDESVILRDLLQRLADSGLQPMETDELIQSYPKRDRVALSLLQHAAEDNQVVEVTEGQWLHATALADAIDKVTALFRQEGPFTVAMARDAWASNRKVSVTLLEYLDDQKVTTRRGDVRVVNGIGEK